MGVSGSGKTTVGSILARRLGWAFEEGDRLHPPANIEKMKAGRPLTDEDRAPWLGAIASWVDAQIEARESGIITSSALKRRYRDLINRRGRGVVFIFLSGSQELIADRLAARRGHFMPATLLDSQFEDLEPPAPDEPAFAFDVGAAPEAIVQEIVDRLRLD
jgi:carbohydrate kinase (thermoresistant glucokinase family)